MVSVKTADLILKGKIPQVMARIRTLTVHAPVQMGTVLLEDVFGTQIITTKEIP